MLTACLTLPAAVCGWWWGQDALPVLTNGVVLSANIVLAALLALGAAWGWGRHALAVVANGVVVVAAVVFATLLVDPAAVGALGAETIFVYDEASVALIAFIAHGLPAGTAVLALTPEADFPVGAATIAGRRGSNAFAALACGVIVAEVVGAAVCVGEAACDINCAEAIAVRNKAILAHAAFIAHGLPVVTTILTVTIEADLAVAARPITGVHNRCIGVLGAPPLPV